MSLKTIAASLVAALVAASPLAAQTVAELLQKGIFARRRKGTSTTRS
jgi:hypothetical protein